MRPFEISNGGDCAVATDGAVCLSVRNGGKVWRRRGVKTAAADLDRIIGNVEMAVGDINGVRVYVTHVDGMPHVIMTTDEIWP